MSPAVGGAKKRGSVKGVPALVGAWRWNIVVVGGIRGGRWKGGWKISGVGGFRRRGMLKEDGGKCVGGGGEG